MKRSELKELAKNQIKGNVGRYFFISIALGLLIALSIMVPFGAFIFAPILTMGLVYICFDMRAGKKAEVSTLFAPFGDGCRVWFASFLTGLFIFLWSLLLIIPGIIAAFRYALTFYILYENKELTARESITLSKEMMKGHKADYFVLILSFIPWFLLGIITLGFAFIYIEPYMQMTFLNFYDKVKEEYYNNNSIPAEE